jgi:hypothetical protein
MPRGKLKAPVSVLTMIEGEQHEALRLIAFNERRSVADLVREGIAEVLRKHARSRRPARVRVAKEERIRAAAGR